jgi:hypothetical protein
MRFLRFVNTRTTLLLVVGLAIIVNGFLLYRHQTKAPNPDDTSSGGRETSSVAYVENVGDIQDAAVQSFTRIHDRIRRYDTLTAEDAKVIEADYLALETYSTQAEDLDVPEEYKGQHELFSGAIGDLYAAAEIARRVTAAPISATAADFKEYDDRIAEATSGLKQSNEVLAQDYSTVEEGLPKVGSLAFNGHLDKSRIVML